MHYQRLSQLHTPDQSTVMEAVIVSSESGELSAEAEGTTVVQVASIGGQPIQVQAGSLAGQPSVIKTPSGQIIHAIQVCWWTDVLFVSVLDLNYIFVSLEFITSNLSSIAGGYPGRYFTFKYTCRNLFYYT